MENIIKYKKKIFIVIGTRPELIKQIPVYYECIKKIGKGNVLLINSGQHKQFLNIYVNEKKIKFDITLKNLQSSKSLKKNIKKSIKHKEKASLKDIKIFIARVEKNKKKCLKFLHHCKIINKKVFIYGASTKGNVLLQYFKLDRKTIEYIADRNPFKWGKYTPGTNIKIIAEKTSRLQKPKLYIVLPWHFKNEIIKRKKIFLKNKGTLFFPLPKCEIIKMDKK